MISNLCHAESEYLILFRMQCRVISAGFKGSQLIRIHAAFNYALLGFLILGILLVERIKLGRIVVNKNVQLDKG